MIRDERGFMAMPVLTVFLVICFSAFAVTAGTAFGVKKNAAAVYSWFCEAMDFAASAANRDGDLTRASLRSDAAREHFQTVFSRMMRDTMYAGRWSLREFNPVSPGQQLPNGRTARQPGYVAVVDVGIYSGDVPFLGRQTVDVPMRYFAAVKSFK